MVFLAAVKDRYGQLVATALRETITIIAKYDFTPDDIAVAISAWTTLSGQRQV